jgi:hypothetical protein
VPDTSLPNGEGSQPARPPAGRSACDLRACLRHPVNESGDPRQSGCTPCRAAPRTSTCCCRSSWWRAQQQQRNGKRGRGNLRFCRAKTAYEVTSAPIGTCRARASGRQHPAPAATAADTPATGAPARRCWHPRGPAAKPAPPHEAGWGLTLGCRRPVRRRHLHDGRCCFRAGLNLKSFRDGFGCGVRLRAQDKGVRAVPRQGLVRRTGADLCAFERRCHGRGDAWVTRARDGGSLQDCAQSVAAADVELAVDAVEMVVDGTDRDGKPVGDLGA